MTDIKTKTLTANILVVDDNPENVKLLEMMLKYAGYTQVQSTLESRDVKDLYQNNNFDLMLLDIRMPHLDGFQVMQQLSEIITDDYLPVLVLTAQNDQATRLKALQLGAKDFVTKPFEKTEVLHRIHNLLEVRFLYNERKSQNEQLEKRVLERTRELEGRNQELEKTRLEIVNRLARAGEYRDNDTGMHVVRMSKYCYQLAIAAGFNKVDAEMILQASPLHDVGKIGVPDNILLKPGKLDDTEWLEMKKHSEIGADILENASSKLMQIAQKIAATHHEKWDGSGYPNGMKGEEIPIEGRIAAICDVFDALTANRPYKSAWTVDAAMDLIRQESGKHFDPSLTICFENVLPEILKIKNAHAEIK